MVSADGRYVIVYNGEIYNHRDLRVQQRHRVVLQLREGFYFFDGMAEDEAAALHRSEQVGDGGVAAESVAVADDRRPGSGGGPC